MTPPAVRPSWLIPLACWLGLSVIVWPVTAATYRNALVGALAPARIHGSEPAVCRAVYAAADLMYRHSNYSPDAYDDAYDVAYNTARALGAGRARARELAEQAARGSEDAL